MNVGNPNINNNEVGSSPTVMQTNYTSSSSSSRSRIGSASTSSRQRQSSTRPSRSDRGTSSSSTSSSTSSSSSRTLYNLMEPKFFYPIIFLIIFLMIMLILVLSGTNLNQSIDKIGEDKTANKVAAEIFLVLFITLLIVGISVMLVPNFKELKELFTQISNVFYIVAYTIFLIVLFSSVPTSTLNGYPYLFTIPTILLGIFSFYKGLSGKYVEKFDLNYERIKMMIVFFCFICTIGTYYTVNPGGLIVQYFGSLMLLTLLLAIFMFIYLIILFTLGNKSSTSKTSSQEPFYKKFTKFSFWGTMSFFLFLAIVAGYIASYEGGFFADNNKSRAGGSIVIILLIGILFSVLFISNTFPELSDQNSTTSKVDMFQRSMSMLFGGVISIMIILWIVISLQDLSGQSSIISFILNILLVLVLLGLVYKVLFMQSPNAKYSEKQNAFKDFIINSIFYIPCLFNDLLEKILSIFVKDTSGGKNHWNMLLLSIVLLLAYFAEPFFRYYISQQGGQLLVNQPIYTNVLQPIGTYSDFTKSDDVYDYNYGISFWLYLDAFPPNTNNKYNEFSSILNYADKPKVMYNAQKNTLLITMKHDNRDKRTNDDKLLDFDSNGDRILYKNDDMLLQKWNNIIINYNGGIMDIFLNGELVKSNHGVVPYYKLDNLVVGENNGYIGGLCNLVYHRKVLSASNVSMIYNSQKKNSPPVSKPTSSETIVNKS